MSFSLTVLLETQQGRELRRLEKLNLRNYRIGWHIQKEQDEKCPLAKNLPVDANWRGDISTVMLR